MYIMYFTNTSWHRVTIETSNGVHTHSLTHTISWIPHSKLQKLTAIGVVGHSDDTHWLLRYVSTQHLHVSSCVFVRPKHRPPHPVSPEDVVPVHSQAKWMHRLILQHHLQGEAQPQSWPHAFKKFQPCHKLEKINKLTAYNRTAVQIFPLCSMMSIVCVCMWVCMSLT